LHPYHGEPEIATLRSARDPHDINLAFLIFTSPLSTQTLNQTIIIPLQ
jgi:hypothetical protein